MRVWLADDKEDQLLPDIHAYQRSSASRDFDQAIEGVNVLGVSSVDCLREKIADCLNGSDDLPDLIFLDLVFESREEGIEALRFLKWHPNCDIRKVPVVMYSQSDSASDVYVTMVSRANAYLAKGELKEFWQAVNHWQLTKLPPASAPNDVQLDFPD
jgi:CheY-like chemotaxis protein